MAVVCGITITRASSLLSGKSLNTSAGRTLAAKPKSTRQISPGRVLFILGFHCIKHLKPFQGPLIAVGQSHAIFLSIDNATHNFPPRFVRQFWNFGNDFGPAHGENIHAKQKSSTSHSNDAAPNSITSPADCIRCVPTARRGCRRRRCPTRSGRGSHQDRSSFRWGA